METVSVSEDSTGRHSATGGREGTGFAQARHADLLAPVGSPDEALTLTRRLATGHYENFSVVSLLLPRRLRQDFCNLYAFCRIADDLGDCARSRDEALRDLDTLRRLTLDCYEGRTTTGLFTALRQTIVGHDIPAQPFLDLIDAFQQDQRVTRYDSFAQVADYCRRSANPVGRLVLYACGYGDETRHALSDKTCTALQLINFCQDVRRDLLDLDRVYIPRETLAEVGLTMEAFEQAVRDGSGGANLAAARRAIEKETDRAEQLFNAGEALLPMLSADVRGQVRLFTLGGRAIVRAIRKRGHDTLTGRPVLGKRSKAALIGRVMVLTLASRFASGGPAGDRDDAAARSAAREVVA